MDQFIDIFKVLSDETRLRIILLLSNEELCVCELCGILDVSQSSVSRNLAKLREMEIVVDDRREKFVFYKIKKGNILLNEILKSITLAIDKDQKFINDLDRLHNKDIYRIRNENNYGKKEILQ